MKGPAAPLMLMPRDFAMLAWAGAVGESRADWMREVREARDCEEGREAGLGRCGIEEEDDER